MNHVPAELTLSASSGRTARVCVQPSAPDHVEIIVEDGTSAIVATITKAEFAHLAASVIVPAELAAQFLGGQ